MSDTPTTQTTFAPGDRVHIAYTFFAVGGLPATVLEVHPGAIKVEVDRYPGGRISVAPEHLTMLNGTGDVMGTKKRARTAPGQADRMRKFREKRAAKSPQFECSSCGLHLLPGDVPCAFPLLDMRFDESLRFCSSACLRGYEARHGGGEILYP